MQLRPYQQAAVDAVYNHLRDRDDNPCVVIPTAGGKTNCMATICRDAVLQWGGRVLILAHVKELLQQTADKLTQSAPRWISVSTRRPQASRHQQCSHHRRYPIDL